MASTRLLVIVVAAAAAAAAVATWTMRELDEEDSDEDEATVSAAATAQISEDSAKVLALLQVPGGTIAGGELETENGTLLYSFDVKVPGKSGLEEVHISATTGEVLSHEHESDDDEKAEEAKDSLARKKG